MPQQKQAFSKDTPQTEAYILVQNITGATLSIGAAVEWDVVSATDGAKVTACKSGSLAGLFAGVVVKSSIADSAYGFIQTRGFCTSAYVSKASAGSAVGAFLKPIAGVFYNGLTMSAATTSGHIFVTSLETITGSAGFSSQQTLEFAKVFLSK